MSPDGTVSPDLTASIVSSFLAGGYEESINLIKKIPGNSKTENVWLIEARCHELRGDFRSALTAAGHLIQKSASHEKWKPGSPRMMAVTLGANAAMQLGMSDKALRFYQTVLKFDPDAKKAREQYRGLKKVIKLMDQAKEQIVKGYNKAASGLIDDCLSAMRGLDVDSPLFRSKIQLKLCAILSGMGKHEEALRECDAAVTVRADETVPPSDKKEAYLIRAEALVLDMNYDDAVADFRAAFDIVPEAAEEKRDLHQRLQQAVRQQEDFNGGKKDHFYNEHRGFPDGKPPERDHLKILELPVNLEEHGKEVKCR